MKPDLTYAPGAAVLLALISLAASAGFGQPRLEQDKGAGGVWQTLLKLHTTASVLHTTAHPDDEHGGTLAWLGRGVGARVGLLTLTRGESGDNAIGPELFDALGLIRTDELLVANRYYGVDRQYFTSVVDYGYSKRVEEAWRKWDRDALLREVVRVIRIDRPLVVISRFQGSTRDGHGQHVAAGLITRDAFDAAGDANRFPELLEEGLRPWQPLKLYIGGVREDEEWTVAVDAGRYSAWLGASYQAFARRGLGFQRSQNAGRVTGEAGPSGARYLRVATHVAAPDREEGLFDGIRTSVAAIFDVLQRPEPGAVSALLARIERSVVEAVEAFSIEAPSASVPALTRGLQAAREAIARLDAEPDAQFMLRVKEEQFVDAINAALGIEFTAIAQPPGTIGPARDAPLGRAAELGPVVAGQRFDVEARLTHQGASEITVSAMQLDVPARWEVTTDPLQGRLTKNQPLRQRFAVRVAEDASSSRLHFTRPSLAESHYQLSGSGEDRHRAYGRPLISAVARYMVSGVHVGVQQTVRRREANVPYGYELRELHVAPALAVNLTPAYAVVPVGEGRGSVTVDVEVINNQPGVARGALTLELPEGWHAEPGSVAFAFTRAGERATYRITVTPVAVDGRTYRLAAVATMGGREFREGYQVVAHRDLETRYLSREAVSEVRGVDVTLPDGLKVGYVMGIGDRVPEGIAQLGAEVQLLNTAALAEGALAQFDAIMIGTRAYAVRDDLMRHNQRLLQYVEDGGNLIVLYNTQEFVPSKLAPFPGELPRGAQEVSEEDAPIELLAPTHPVFVRPNRITLADFEGWVEQRGSKFFGAWDAAYTPMVSTHDTGQAPQHGGWLWAPYGDGHYTYFAYALHRQLPYGVPGAYRLLANLLALGMD